MHARQHSALMPIASLILYTFAYDVYYYISKQRETVSFFKKKKKPPHTEQPTLFQLKHRPPCDDVRRRRLPKTDQPTDRIYSIVMRASNIPVIYIQYDIYPSCWLAGVAYILVLI
jgi:hypothetical protein